LLIIILNSIFQNSHIEVIEIIKQIQYFLFFILVYNINWRENNNSVIKGIITFLIIILSFGSIELLYILLNNKVDLTNNLYLISSTFSHKNIYSFVVLLSLPFIAIWKVGNKKKIILLSWSSIILITLQTRSVLLGIICALTYLFISENKSLKHKAHKVFIISLPILLASFFIQSKLGTIDLFVGIFDFSNSSSERYATISERLFLWRHSLQMFLDHWLFGVGIGNWPIYFPFYGLTLWRLRQGEVIMQRPHNDFIENFNELGILGGVAFTLLLVYPLLKKSNYKYKSIFNCGLICFIIVSLFSFPQERIIPSILFLTIVAYKLQDNVHLKINSYFLVIIFACTIPFTAICYSHLKSEISFKKYITNRNSIDQTNAINLLSKSKSKYLKLDKTSTPLDWYIGEVYLKNKNVNNAIKYFNQALEIHPYNIHILNSLGRCYLLKKDHSVSINYFKKAILIAPFFENALYNLAHNYSITGNYNQAIKTLKNIEDKKSKKFIKINLFYAKRVMKRKLDEINFNELYKDNLINMLSNDNWISSMVIKSYKNYILYTEQLLLDIEYISKRK
jgi:O-antigen ligase/Tfp pilus assembly protein PilF